MDSKTDIDSLVSDFNNHVNNALVNSLKVSKKKSHQNQQYSWDPNIFRLTCDENRAFCLYNNANPPEKLELEDLWKKCKNRLKYAVRSKERSRLQINIREIESLRSRNPRDYWRGLQSLDNTTPSSSTIPLFVKNNLGTLVGGSDASKVWMESFSKLGLEKSDFGDYDTAFYSQIKEKVARYQIDSFDSSFELDYPITLAEVKKAVHKLKKGKAVGIDGIFNKVWKFDGDQATFSLATL